MDEKPPPGDAVLVQFQMLIIPTLGPYYSFWVRSKEMTPICSIASGTDYTYLTVGQSIDLYRGAFPNKFTLLYLGQGRVSISSTLRRNLRPDDVEILRVDES